MAKATVKALDIGGLELMWNFLRMGYQKPNVAALKENCDLLRQMMIQKTIANEANSIHGGWGTLDFRKIKYEVKPT